jgi:hypothetical protein
VKSRLQLLRGTEQYKKMRNNSICEKQASTSERYRPKRPNVVIAAMKINESI